MAQATYVQEGCQIDYTPAAAVAAGEVVIQQDLIGVANTIIAANALGALAVEGVFDFAKSSGAWVVGDLAYWDDANNVASRTASGNRHIGICVKAAASGDTVVRVKLAPEAQDMAYVAVAAGTALTNSTVATALGTFTIPAGTLKAGDIIRVRAQGIATATNSTDTLTIIAALGGTTVVSTGAVDVADNDIFYVDIDIVIRTAGASGTMVAAGITVLGAEGTATARARKLASTTVDTTAALALAITGTWSVASASNSCRLDVLDVQIISK